MIAQAYGDYVADKKEDVGEQAHYALLNIQPIEIMKANLTKEEYRGFLLGNIIKYSHRKKGQDLKDAQKIQIYAKWLEEDIRERG